MISGPNSYTKPNMYNIYNTAKDLLFIRMRMMASLIVSINEYTHHNLLQTTLPKEKLTATTITETKNSKTKRKSDTNAIPKVRVLLKSPILPAIFHK